MNEKGKIKISQFDGIYDKSLKYKSASIRYISKRKFKDLECDKESIQGFFCLRRATSENVLFIKDFSFDLLENKPKLCSIKGYVKELDSDVYYAVTKFPLAPILIVLFTVMLICLMIFNYRHIGNDVFKPWVPCIDESIDSSERVDDEQEHKQIQINGFTEWTIQAGETENLPISLKNPSGNPCYFTFVITLEDGSKLYESKHVPPGSSINAVKLLSPLESGTYKAYVTILTNELNTGTPMNSAQTKILIHAI